MHQSTNLLSSSSVHSASARAPAKIILSGEHSVVYGASAVALAIRRYNHLSFTADASKQQIITRFDGLSSNISYPLSDLSLLKSTLDRRFQQYAHGQLAVGDILNQPHDLAIYAISSLMQHGSSYVDESSLACSIGMAKNNTHNHTYQHAYNQSMHKSLEQTNSAHLAAGILSSSSNIPLGAGMGSSASAIAAVLVLYEQLLDIQLTNTQRFQLVRFCERLQHGKGSAIDAATVTYGGINHLKADQHCRLSFSNLHQKQNHQDQNHQHTDIKSSAVFDDWYWLYTGKPHSSTGQCVSHVRQHYGNEQRLWTEFDDITTELLRSLQQLDKTIHAAEVKDTQSIIDSMQNSIRQSIISNQQLLSKIGVVSATAQAVIKHIERLGGAAKVSGAGTVTGEHNGLILAYLPTSVIDTVYNNSANINNTNKISNSKKMINMSHIDNNILHKDASFLKNKQATDLMIAQIIAQVNDKFAGYIKDWGRVEIDHQGAILC